jgi:hypothetical protein
LLLTSFTELHLRLLIKWSTRLVLSQCAHIWVLKNVQTLMLETTLLLDLYTVDSSCLVMHVVKQINVVQVMLLIQ